MSNVIQNPPPGNANTQNPSFSFPKPVGFGNLLVVQFDWANTSGLIESFQDNLGNNWQQIYWLQVPGTLRTLYCYACSVNNPGLCTIQVNTDQARNYYWSIYEVQYGSLALDGQPILSTSSALASSATAGPLTTAFPNSVVFAHTHAGPIQTSPALPWTSEVNNQHGTAFQIATTPGTFNATWTFTSSNWGTAIVAFQSSGTEPQPPPMGPVPLISALCSPNQLADPNALADPNVYSISGRTHWANMQPHRPPGGLPTNNPNDSSYNWAFIDSLFAQAAQWGKYVWLRIVVQEFDVPGWAQSEIQSYVDTGGVTRFIWYDPNYQALMTAMIQAVATRYGSNPLLKVFSCNFAAAGAGDWDMPHVPPSTNPIGASNWSSVNSWTCPAFNQTVVITPVAGQPVYPGWVVWVQGFGWFQVQSITGTTAAPTSVTLLNLGYSGNASSGTVANTVVMQVSDIANLTSPMYNYTTDKVVAALENIINVAIAALPPNVIYSHEVGRNNRLDPQPNSGVTWSYNCATRMAQRGYAITAPGRWAIAKNGWSAARNPPQIAFANQDNDVMFLLAQTVYGSTNTSGTTGSIPQGGLQCGQFTWNVIDPSGLYLPSTTGGQSAYQVNGGVPYGPADCQSVFNRAMDVIRLYGIAIMETYMVDITGGLLDSYLGYIPPIPPIRPNPQPPSRLIMPPYAGQTQVSNIGVPPPLPPGEDGPRCSVYLPPPMEPLPDPTFSLWNRMDIFGGTQMSDQVHNQN